MRKVLTTNELSRLIGRSAGAIRNLKMRGRIPYRKAGGRLHFFEDEIETWIEKSEGLRLEDINGNHGDL